MNSFNNIISQHLLDDTNAIFVIGEERDNFLSKIVHDKMIYRRCKDPCNMVYLVNLLKTNIKLSILRMAHGIDLMSVFDNYISLVSEGGIIIIDDYQQAKPKLDQIEVDNKRPGSMVHLGRFKTLFCENNKIILRREPIQQDIKFAIVMCTYYRQNGKSSQYIRRSLTSIAQQSYQNYKLFLMGDKYENKAEFESFSKLIPKDKLEAINLPTALERENCKMPANLWAIGGANSVNHGLDLARKQGFKYYVHLDDDDYWNTFHLRNVATGYKQFPESCFIVTYCINDHMNILPRLGSLGYNNYHCQGTTAFHSSYGFRLDVLPFKYIVLDLNAPETPHPPADANLLDRIGLHCIQNNLKTLGIPVVSAFYDVRVPPQGIDFLLEENHDKEPLVHEMNRSRSDLMVKEISTTMVGKTFHHHYHLLYDLRTLLGPSPKTYMEIGVFHGGSLALMLQHPYQTRLIGVDVFMFDGQYDNVRKNITKFNIHDRVVTLHKEDSHSVDFVGKLRLNCRTDILFIDGDHSYEGVKLDFELFSPLVNPGGYIVFDDYNDAQFSPQVRPAVDAIVQNIKKGYEIIGTLPNFLNVHPDYLKEYNEFIIRKRN